MDFNPPKNAFLTSTIIQIKVRCTKQNKTNFSLENAWTCSPCFLFSDRKKQFFWNVGIGIDMSVNWNNTNQTQVIVFSFSFRIIQLTSHSCSYFMHTRCGSANNVSHVCFEYFEMKLLAGLFLIISPNFQWNTDEKFYFCDSKQRKGQRSTRQMHVSCSYIKQMFFQNTLCYLKSKTFLLFHMSYASNEKLSHNMSWIFCKKIHIKFGDCQEILSCKMFR